MFGLGIFEIVIILFVALIFIGPKKLPEVAKNLGKGLRDFQNAVKGITDITPKDEPSAPKPATKVYAHDDDEDGDHDDDDDFHDDEDVIHTTASHKEEKIEIIDKDKKES